MQKILVLTDFSTASEAALHYSLDFAQHVGAEVMILHVVCPPIPAATNFHVHSTLLEDEEKQARKKMTSYRQLFEGRKYLDGSGELKVSTLIEAEGGIIPKVEQISQEHQPFLIVMGTHGMTRAEEILMGSITADIIESNKTPAVLAIPSHAKFESWERIVYAANFTNKDKKVLEILLELAGYFSDSKIDYLHICTDEDERSENLDKLYDLKQYFKSIPVSILDFRLRQNEDLDDGVDDYLARYDTSLLVMLTEHRGFFESLWHRSRTKQMSFHTKVPLLVLKTKYLGESARQLDIN